MLKKVGNLEKGLNIINAVLLHMMYPRKYYNNCKIVNQGNDITSEELNLASNFMK